MPGTPLGPRDTEMGEPMEKACSHGAHLQMGGEDNKINTWQVNEMELGRGLGRVGGGVKLYNAFLTK